MADIGVNYSCNSNCIMCTLNTSLVKNYKDISKEDIFNQILATDVNDNKILITGGEPTLRKDILDILSFVNLKKPNATIDFVTNARLFSNERFLLLFKRIKNLYVISEFHHSKQQVHDSITRTPNSFKQAYAGVKNLLKNEFEFELRIIVSKLNYLDLENISLFYVRNFSGVRRVVIFPIDIIGNAYVNKDIVFVKISSIIPYLEKAIDRFVESNIEVLLYHIPFCLLNKKYFRFVKSGLTVYERRVEFSSVCNNCIYEDSCPRIWKTYLNLVGDLEFKPILR